VVAERGYYEAPPGITTMTTSNGIAGSADDPQRQRDAPPRAGGLSFRRMLAPLALAALLASAGAATFPRWSDTFYKLWNSLSLGEQTPPPAPAVADDQAQAESFFAQQALPILEETARKNQDAIARALDTLGESIDKYRGGVDPFIADLRSWSTTYHIFLKSVVGWWHGDESLANYVDGRFRRHLFSDQTIADDVRNALVQLDEDLAANRNQMLVNLQTASAASNMAAPPKWPTIEAFSRAVSERARAGMAPSARAFVVSNVLASTVVDAPTAAFLPAVVASAVKAAATAAMRAAATSASETVLAEGGVVAADAGSGGALGSEVPVVGNAVGFCAGLVVSVVALHYEGIVQDEKLRRDLNGYIDGLKAALVGAPGAPSELAKGMKAYVREIDRGEADLVKQSVIEAGKQP
jgi:hypothetical protein